MLWQMLKDVTRKKNVQAHRVHHVQEVQTGLSAEQTSEKDLRKMKE